MRIGCYIVASILMCNARACKSLELYPNVTLEGTEAPELTQVNNLFIYNWPEEEQARYPSPGAVTALEYCYQRMSTQLVPVFTLLFLKEASKGFRVTHTITVDAEDLSSCTNRRGIDTCCEKTLLEPPSWFPVPSESTAFGIFAKGRNRILGYNVRQQKSTAGYQLPVDRMDDGLIRVQLNNTAMIEYRMLNLVIEAVDFSVILNRTNTATQTPFTDDPLATITYKTDNETAGETTTERLSIMVTVEIVLGCFIIALFFISLILWVYLCHKARELQRERNLHQQEKNNPIYEHISSSKLSSNSDGPLPELLSFYRNPAYALQQAQIEPEQRPEAKTNRPKLHHQWLL